MVNFSVFNELSLPLDVHSAQEKFGILFKLLEMLREQRLNQIRMSNDFNHYNILKDTNFKEFVGRQEQDLKRRLISFATNQIIKIDSPIIRKSEQEQRDTMNGCEYYYNNKSNDGGLACADIWNTVAVSFNVNSQWKKHTIILRKKTLTDNGEISKTTEIKIKHASDISHLTNHKAFFKYLENEAQKAITRKNFWTNRNKNFPKTIIFCPEVESQIKKLDQRIFQLAISRLRDIETNQKCLTDFNFSGESKTVRQNVSMKKERMFTVNGNKEFFENHLKGFSKGYRIYFLKANNKIYIGYIGKHLTTSSHK